MVDVIDLTDDEDIGKVREEAVISGPTIVPKLDFFTCVTNHAIDLVKQETYDSTSIHLGKDIDDRLVNKQNYAGPSPACANTNSKISAEGTMEYCQPLYRQFWKAGEYHAGQPIGKKVPNGLNHLRVHPKFLHSNATSHKWVFGAIAELLDNAVDEIINGCTFVKLDKITNLRDGTPALLFQDDGGGMDPQCIRKCMSFGYSDKNSSAIGQYGNGFKTSTMRLGADAIVFSRCMNSSKTCTQSIGLLSFTYLTRTGQEDTVVPMVDFLYCPTTGERKIAVRSTEEDWSCNFSTILQWSPYRTEEELVKQFDDIGPHGTKIVIYNLWFNNDGETELDFNSDPEDIQINGTPKPVFTNHGHDEKLPSEMHVDTRLRYSLRAYASVLYLGLPANFSLLLRGKPVEYVYIADHIKYPQYILYKPHICVNQQAAVITTIGFDKEAPKVKVHGFNVYHKNRLIVPFWRVLDTGNSQGRGIVGVLEANFIKPAHDKQDFEKTIVLQKLENRLKEMTTEYWKLHCELIGYQAPVRRRQKTKPVPIKNSQHVKVMGSSQLPTNAQNSQPNHKTCERIPVAIHALPAVTDLHGKRKLHGSLKDNGTQKRPLVAPENVDGSCINQTKQTTDRIVDNTALEQYKVLLEQNTKLQKECSEYKKLEEELNGQVLQLERELKEVQDMCEKKLLQSKYSDAVKEEKKHFLL